MIFGDTIALTERSLKKWIRNPFAVMVGAIQGIFWLALFGNSFNLANILSSSTTGSSFIEQAFGGAPNYITFLAPGVISIIALTGMSFMGVDFVFDRINGYLDEIRSYPIRRSSIYFGGVLQNIAKGMVLAPITFLIALLVPNGMKLVQGFGIVNLLGVFAAVAMLTAVFSTLFTAIAVSVKSTDSFFALINFLTFPIMFTSTAFFPITFFPSWLKPIAQTNPISLTSNAVRLLIVNRTLSMGQLSTLGTDIAGLLMFFALFATMGILLARKALKAR
jgi:ABC-2 type transport system permease protein